MVGGLYASGTRYVVCCMVCCASEASIRTLHSRKLLRSLYLQTMYVPYSPSHVPRTLLYFCCKAEGTAHAVPTGVGGC